MLVSLPWLQEFVPYSGTVEELGDRLTMLGLELEGVVRPFEALECLVVGHVLECEKHPEADTLSVCKVDVGTEILDIVCGAPNVRKGLFVAVIKVGSQLPDGTLIKSAVLRGLPSNGMICSERELGLSEEHDGIMELEGDLIPGSNLVDALRLDREVLDISITPNRGDCLSVLGVAREVALAYNLPLTLPKLDLVEAGTDAADLVSIHIADKDLCPLYQARILESAPAAQSPAWLRYRLHAVGLRAISNHVDVTNYIMMELGQPLHAFDLGAVKGNQIHVAPAIDGEVFKSLDGQDRKLVTGDITIRDTERAIGLGGVMGGANSEITESSSRVLLECANFLPTAIRRTAKRLGLHSDASHRFERGVDQVGAVYAINRAAALMAQISGGTVCKGIVKAEPKPWQAPRITLRKARAVGLLGIDLDTSFCTDTLTKLGCTIEATRQDPSFDPINPEVWEVSAPSHRYDLVREADLIEEIVRVYGVDRVPAVLPSITHSLDQAGSPEPIHTFQMRIKHWAAGLGLNEAINYSFVSHKELDALGMVDEPRISIMNPLSEEQNVLRTHLLPGLLQNLRTNLSQGVSGIRLFEVAMSFVEDTSSETTARETSRLAIMLCGNRFDSAWPQTQADLDYQDLKGMVEHLLRSFGLPEPTFAVSTAASWFAPCVSISVNGVVIGTAGKVRTDLADSYYAIRPVWAAEINLNALHAMYLERKVQFTPLMQFPPVRRDITFMVPLSVRVEDILKAITAMDVPLLTNVQLIDFFEPKQVEEKNLTYRLTFRHKERTLKDKEVDKLRDSIAKTVSAQVGGRV